MTKKDLEKANKFIERVLKLPRNADLRNKLIWNDATEDEGIEYIEVKKEIGRIRIELNAFVKVRFGILSTYMMQLDKIDFEHDEIAGLRITTNSIDSNNKTWNKAFSQLLYILYEIRAEITEIIDNEPDTLSIYRKREENKLKTRAAIIFWIICYCIPIAIAIFFAYKIRNTETFDWKDVMSWINPNEFGKIEFLLIIVEAVIVTISTYCYQKYKGDFVKRYYERYRVQKP